MFTVNPAVSIIMTPTVSNCMYVHVYTCADCMVQASQCRVCPQASAVCDGAPLSAWLPAIPGHSGKE